MSNAVTTRSNGNGPAPAVVEDVIIRGDLARLSDSQRTEYYYAVCKSVGLNPLTKPFEYITLNGRLTLYALRNCTDQLRKVHKISVVDMTETERDGVYIVTCKVINDEGRTDIAKGAVSIVKLQGEALANALMKAETKAKRRATLSICGLSLLDETEIEDIPASSKRPNPHVTRPEDIVDEPTGPTIPEGDASVKVLPKGSTRAEFERAQKEMYAIADAAELAKWAAANANRFQIFHPDYKQILRGLYAAHLEGLKAKPAAVKPDNLDIPASLDRRPKAMPNPADDISAWLQWADGKLARIREPDALELAWNDELAPIVDGLFPPDQEEAMGLYRKHERRLAP